ncbi:MAG TPA: hypothetical protein VGI32_01050 [Steroidobacteraceae bacterium]|jgi:hypothetical protein
MLNAFDYPLLIFGVSFFVLWLVARLGWSVLKRRRELDSVAREDFDVIVGATLTLLALLIGFSFSMAIGRYDQRKNYEEAEANAIGTELVRASLLPAADWARVRTLLHNYLDQRVLFYLSRDYREIREINIRTAQLQTELWSAVQVPAVAQPNPLVALTVAGMNDVLNSQGYTQAAWSNRIPPAAWSLMALVAICCNLLVGYGARITRVGGLLLMVLPLVVSIAFLLIADIDSPRGGLIHVHPQNLLGLSATTPAH